MSLPKITKKQQEILILLHQFRFLNRVQIQALLKHKNKKTINLWLPDLTNKQYIGRIYSNRIPEKMKPAVYYLVLGGISYLKTIGYQSVELQKLYRQKDRSENFIGKHILIADIWLDLQNKSDGKIKYMAATASDITDPDYKYHFLAEPGPDLVFVKDSKGTKQYYLLEIIEPTLPMYSIRKKIRNYFDFFFSNSSYCQYFCVCNFLPEWVQDRFIRNRYVAIPKNRNIFWKFSSHDEYFCKIFLTIMRQTNSTTHGFMQNPAFFS